MSCRNSKYGKCAHCEENNTNEAWCLACDPDIATRWTSRNKNIDDCMKAFQLRTFAYGYLIEWIPFNKLVDIIKIGEGGFGSIYKATWLDGIQKIEKVDANNYIYKRSRESNSIVALKTLSGSKTCDPLSEFKNHMQCILFGSKLQIYGLTYNSETEEYFMVFQYADDGNIHRFLRSKFNNLTWELKLNQLKKISKDLSNIHEAGYVHADFHSGNILHNKGTSFVSDLGLSKKQNEKKAKDDFYENLAYVAPEIFFKEDYDQSLLQKLLKTILNWLKNA
ncbi:kinase-like domain-containing protein [Gigaspora rosea]|uniref:Kinase-like domain-containing protein n=1 Tax=Gigaspora rosea TaxID=44941 RepID=A0A397UQ24_9GLOM|nr:kinase-like domain-containing protein [Gigaspora rosea]